MPSIDSNSAVREALLSGAGVGLRIGPFDVRWQIRDASLHEPFLRLYRDHPIVDCGRVFAAHVRLEPRWRVFPRPARLVRFSVDGMVPHEDMPAEHGLAVLEWGLNLALAMRAHGYLLLHAGALERAGRALLLPAAPGEGKTTLCAALAHRGWRLLSDEFGMLRPGSIELLAIPRPMPLKNESIEVLRRFTPDAEFGPLIPGTRKGNVAHVKPPTDSVRRAGETAAARWCVFPRWQAGAALALEPVSPAEAFMGLTTNAFNYELLGEAAFRTVAELVQRTRCFRLNYSDLEEAAGALTALADADAARR